MWSALPENGNNAGSTCSLGASLSLTCQDLLEEINLRQTWALKTAVYSAGQDPCPKRFAGTRPAIRCEQKCVITEDNLQSVQLLVTLRNTMFMEPNGLPLPIDACSSSSVMLNTALVCFDKVF